MKKFFRELRRREVFRTAGLYIGICWILIEAASVILPIFDAPEWILRAMFIVAIVGFPMMLVLAWVFDVTEHGVDVQADPTDTIVARLGRRGMDFVVISILTLALVFSFYLNVSPDPVALEIPEPVSVLIADFDNRTGNSLFDGPLEHALQIGVEGAPHITSFNRNEALGIADRLQPKAEKLDAAAAQRVAEREGVNLVLSGGIDADGQGFDLKLQALHPGSGEVVFDVSSEARSADAIFTAIGQLSADIREELGDTTIDQVDDESTRLFFATSLEAAQAHTTATKLAYDGKHNDAVLLYRKATELEPGFGRAYAGWAMSEFRLGRTQDANELWQTAISQMETVTERERLRTLGLYYASVMGDFENAVQSFSELVEKYPADAAGHSNLAVAAFHTLDFKTAAAEGRRVMDLYPNSQLYRSNFALYAMYSGDFGAAAEAAQSLIDDYPEYGASYLPMAIARIDAGDLDAAQQAYRQMAAAKTGAHQESLATLGLADLETYRGNMVAARALLVDGIEQDIAAENQTAAAVKNIALAQTYIAAGSAAPAIAAASRAVALSSWESVNVAAARVFLDAGDAERAAAIATELSAKLLPQSHAYGQMLQAILARSEGEHVQAVDMLRDAVGLADLWLIRYELGRTYLEAGFMAEALSEFISCDERRGEATSVFFDDMPSYRYLATLPYWTARAQQELGMQSSSMLGYETFLSLRPEGGPLAEDARRRLVPPD